MLAVGLILIGIISRFIVHFENFTPVIAIALFAGYYLPKRQAIIVPLLMIIISDIAIGLHSMIAFTWGTLALIAVIGIINKERKSTANILVRSLLAAILFYIVTNFGVWVFYNTYPKSWAGLTECYVAAIPYFRNTLISTFIYVAVLFGAYEFFAARLKGTRLAFVLS